MTGTHLHGLEGTNPLGFFAALGVQIAFEGENEMPKLWWSDDVVPHAIVDDTFTIETIATQVMDVLPSWLESSAIRSGLNPADDVKFKSEAIRTYLENSQNRGLGIGLASCLVAEGSLDNSGVAKPSDLYFTAGSQKFLKIIVEVLEGVTFEDLVDAVERAWLYQGKLKSLMWDVIDDRNYALLASNPSGDEKPTNPGAEALAILGISQYPVFGSSGRTLTQGASGGWKQGLFEWPIWTKPGSSQTVSSLLAHVTGSDPELGKRSKYYPSWGVSQIRQSIIRRSDQGGYGNFGPPKVIWSRPRK